MTAAGGPTGLGRGVQLLELLERLLDLPLVLRPPVAEGQPRPTTTNWYQPCSPTLATFGGTWLLSARSDLHLRPWSAHSVAASHWLCLR